jgi:hypothetical protein
MLYTDVDWPSSHWSQFLDFLTLGTLPSSAADADFFSFLAPPMEQVADKVSSLT